MQQALDLKATVSHLQNVESEVLTLKQSLQNHK
jgi:hypothetical protein